jgi:serine/threonine-protein kinase RsbW
MDADDPDDSTRCVHNFGASAQETRLVLSDIDRALRHRGVPVTARETVEIVLAEIINNVVEHAYSEHPGPVELRLQASAGAIDCVIIDEGVGMPGGMLPDPARRSVTLPMADLPEGGFGWSLIRDLADDLSYHRKDGKNHLAFRIPI